MCTGHRNLRPFSAAVHPENERLDGVPPKPCKLPPCTGAKAAQHV